MKSILFLTPGRRLPGPRFRVHQFVPRLREDGYHVSIAPCVPDKYVSHRDYPFGGWPLTALLTGAKLINRFFSVLRSPFHDLVFIERELIPRISPFFERIAAGLNRAIHFDFDDAIHLRYADTEDNPVARIIRMSKGVTAGNAWLAEYARRFHTHVTQLPTAVETERYTPGRIGDTPFVWTGSSSNLRYLEQIASALRRVPEARVLVICDRPPPGLGIPTEFVPWNETTEVAALRRGRVGLMPLGDDEWAKGKCGFKLIQYMSVGLACVASPVGVNPEILGCEAGILARTEEEWVEALRRLSRDSKLARTMGTAGRNQVEARYSVRALYPRFKASLEETAARSL